MDGIGAMSHDDLLTLAKIGNAVVILGSVGIALAFYNTEGGIQRAIFWLLFAIIFAI